MIVIAIDQGSEFSAYVRYDGANARLLQFGKLPNYDLLHLCFDFSSSEQLVIEHIAMGGMIAGQEVFDACFWAGRFAQGFRGDHVLLKRHVVKMHLCGSMRAKDSNIRQALIDRFGGQSAIKKGGVLYKVSNDVWSALAIAVTWSDQHHVGAPRGTEAA